MNKHWSWDEILVNWFKWGWGNLNIKLSFDFLCKFDGYVRFYWYLMKKRIVLNLKMSVMKLFCSYIAVIWFLNLKSLDFTLEMTKIVKKLWLRLMLIQKDFDSIVAYVFNAPHTNPFFSWLSVCGHSFLFDNMHPQLSSLIFFR